MAQDKDGWLPRYSRWLRPPFHQLTRNPAVPDIQQSSFEPRDRIRVQRGTSRNQYTPASISTRSRNYGDVRNNRSLMVAAPIGAARVSKRFPYRLVNL